MARPTLAIDHLPDRFWVRRIVEILCALEQLRALVDAWHEQVDENPILGSQFEPLNDLREAGERFAMHSIKCCCSLTPFEARPEFPRPLITERDPITAEWLEELQQTAAAWPAPFADAVERSFQSRIMRVL